MVERKSYVDPVTGKGPFRFDAGRKARLDNILFISMDMVPRAFYQGPSGSSLAVTDNIRGLKEDHIYFANAFCASPLCSPSRAAYLTGRYPYITGNSERAHDGHQMHVRENDILFPAYLKSRGYHARHIGKSHIGTHAYMDIFGENDSPWNRWSPPWYDDDEYIRYLHERGLRRFSFDRCIYGRDFTGSGQGNFYGGYIAGQNGAPFPADATYPAYLVEKAISALKTQKDRTQPFYLQLDFFGPHQPFAIPAGMEERERELKETLKLPRSCLELIANGFKPQRPEPRVYRMYRKYWGLEDPEKLRDYMVANMLQFELMDTLLGRLLDYLKREGLYDDTWIFLFADHGEMNGEMGLIDKGAFLNPAVIRVPLIVKPPGDHPAAGQGKIVRDNVSLLDLAPTLLAIASIRTEERLDGFNLLDTLAGRLRPEEKPILFDIWSHVIPNPSIGTVFTAPGKKSYMYTFNAVDDLDELYLLNNPGEMENRVSEAGRQAVLAEAISRMHSIMAADARWAGYMDYFTLTYAERLKKPLGDRQHFL